MSFFKKVGQTGLRFVKVMIQFSWKFGTTFSFQKTLLLVETPCFFEGHIRTYVKLLYVSISKFDDPTKAYHGTWRIIEPKPILDGFPGSLKGGNSVGISHKYQSHGSHVETFMNLCATPA